MSRQHHTRRPRHDAEAKRKPEKVVCVWFEQDNEFDPGSWVVSDELHAPDGKVISAELVEGSGRGNDREAAIEFARDRAKKTGARVAIMDKE